MSVSKGSTIIVYVKFSNSLTNEPLTMCTVCDGLTQTNQKDKTKSGRNADTT